jgi:hypothetical protein
MAKRIPWVTGVAAQTVAKLNALRVGDQIKFGKCFVNDSHNSSLDRDARFFNKALTVIEMDGHELYPLELAWPRHPDMNHRAWCCCLCSIVAWRRPRDPKA